MISQCESSRFRWRVNQLLNVRSPVCFGVLVVFVKEFLFLVCIRVLTRIVNFCLHSDRNLPGFFSIDRSGSRNFIFTVCYTIQMPATNL